MAINRTVLSGSDLQMPSGYEVESAAFHAPVGGGQSVSTVSPRGLRGRLEEWKSSSVAKVSDLKSRSLAKAEGMQTSARASMQTKPMLWAAIAAGAGLSLGLAGRFVHWRKKRREAMPSLVIVEASC